MEECHGYFEALGIPYDPSWADEAVHAVRSDGTLSLPEKKSLILCWFDVTYGKYEGSTFMQGPSREAMSDFLDRSPYTSFEEMLETDYDRENKLTRRSR